jgi:hypothetical protein
MGFHNVKTLAHKNCIKINEHFKMEFLSKIMGENFTPFTKNYYFSSLIARDFIFPSSFDGSFALHSSLVLHASSSSLVFMLCKAMWSLGFYLTIFRLIVFQNLNNNLLYIMCMNKNKINNNGFL